MHILKPIIVITFILGIIVSCTECTTNGNEDQNDPQEILPEEPSIYLSKSDSLYQQEILKNHQTYALPIPVKIDFAGEEVPLNNIMVRESLDKELIVNTYWHSQTLMFHKRANRFFPIIEPILREHNIPEDFKFLALIESGLENVVSPAGAAGYWQFMKSTAGGYGLEVNNYVDERYHIEKSTIAACQYLKSAYDQFGSWTLAAASYNMGKGGVSTRLNEQKVGSYYDLLLNAETARYVFRILAAKCVLSHSENYGFRFRPQDLYPSLETKEIEVSQSISSLVDFAIENGTTYKTLKFLNPWLRNTSLPVNGKTYKIKLPIEGKGLDRISEKSE